MRRFWLGVAAVATLTACSDGNPFAPEEEVDPPVVIPPPTVPEELKGNLKSFTYDKANDKLVIRGVSLDDTPFSAEYRRRPNLDRGGYHAYTAQDGSLDRHYTAYVKDIDGTRASVVLSGGQFGHYFGGSAYERDGGFEPPKVGKDSGMVTYAGRYVGLLNGAGDGGDLLPVEPGTPASVTSRQAAEVTGRVIINADFADNTVNGRVYGRRAVDAGQRLESLDLAPTAIETNGTFTGELTQGPNETRGTYGGIFGGKDAAVVAGTLYAKDHIEGVENEEERGLFVLNQCGTANADALCTQPNP